jgi:hypothetical protein
MTRCRTGSLSVNYLNRKDYFGDMDYAYHDWW